MKSLNFQFRDVPSAVDPLAADAERLILDRADLALVRVRQLLEVLVHHLAGEPAARDEKKLHERINALGFAGKLPEGVGVKALGKVRADANEAAHHKSIFRRNPAVFETQARKHLLLLCRCWALVAGEAPPSVLVLPSPADKLEQTVREFHLQLDHAEDLIERQRQYEEATRVLDTVAPQRLDRQGISPNEADLLMLRKQSLELTISNHTGLQANLPVERARISRLLTWADPRATQEVVHLLNRQAVAHLNALELDQAMAEIEPLLEWSNATYEFRPAALLGDGQVLDWNRGALLGTMGQIYAFRAHAREDLEELVRAHACFDAAIDCFSEPEDIERQKTYRLQALIERMRLGGVLSDREREELIDCIQTTDPSPMLEEAWTPAAFRVAVALKAAMVLGHKVPWAAKIFEWARTVSGEVPLQNPYQAIAGWSVLLFDNAPKTLASALATTAAASGEESELIPWIAGSFLSAHSGTAAPPPPPSLQEWWNKYEISKRNQGPYVATLPFYYG